MTSRTHELVLVTGGSGFLGAYCILTLLQKDYYVRTTIRTPTKREAVLKALVTGGITSMEFERLSFVVVDLIDDAGWDKAMEGCSFVLHVASPFPMQDPKEEDEVIKPAVEGMIHVLKAAKRANVKRVVLTSSFGAIGYGHPAEKQTFDETDWTVLDGPGVSAYIKSKTLAEQAAWHFVASEEGNGLELVVVNPPGIFGPVLDNNLSASTSLVQRLLKGSQQGFPPIRFGVVDVRDVASLHVLLMKYEHAAGERFIASTGFQMSVAEIAELLRKRLPDMSTRVDATSHRAAQLGHNAFVSIEKARKTGWEPRPGEAAILATAKSLYKLGLV